jgi:hypothetical protein
MAVQWANPIGLWLAVAGVVLLDVALLRAEPVPNKRAGRDARELAGRIDKHTAKTWKDNRVEPTALADDAEFLRRVYLDVAGRIPSVDEARSFLADKAPDKREQLIEKLLAGDDYVDHFTDLWAGLLVPERERQLFDGPFMWDVFKPWVRQRVADNTPYDRMVRELLTTPLEGHSRREGRGYKLTNKPAGGAPYFYFKELRPEELTTAVTRQFLGLSLECAQCHNHPYAGWKREQFWQFAAFFAGIKPDGPGFTSARDDPEIRKLSIPGTMTEVEAAFLSGPALDWRGKTSVRAVLADRVTDKDNPFFARAAVNRLWAHFFGQGLVESFDAEDADALGYPVLLELASAFVAQGFDTKFLMRAITLSGTYQRSSAGGAGRSDDKLFARAAVRGLSARQYLESLIEATTFGAPKKRTELKRRPLRMARPDRAGEFDELRELLVGEVVGSLGELDQEWSGARWSAFRLTIPQALIRRNGRFATEATNSDRPGTLATLLADTSLDTAARVEVLFLATLSRPPTAEESERFVRYATRVRDGDAKAALGDVFWALLTSAEFGTNH